MLEWIEFIITLFTSPFEAVATIVIVVVMFGGIKWFAKISKSKLPLGESPEVILRLRLKVTDEDLKQNRLMVISPKQIKRIRTEFLISLVFYLILDSFFGWVIIFMFGDDIRRGRFDMFMAGLMVFMGLCFFFFIGLAGFHLRSYYKELKTKKAVPILTTLVFEENKGEYLGFKFQTHQYKIIVRDSRLPVPIQLYVGVMPEKAWEQVLTLEHQPVILYIAPNTSKLLSFDLLAAKKEAVRRVVSDPMPVQIKE